MQTYPEGAICLVGLSKSPSTNPITYVHQSLIGVFVADPVTGTVYDVEFNTICTITSDFLAELLVGHSLLTECEDMCRSVAYRYHGDSRKAIQVVIRDAAAKCKDHVGQTKE